VREHTEKFKPFLELMKKEGMDDIAIKNFEHYYKHLMEGHTGFISESEIRPVESLPDLEKFPEELALTGKENMAKTVFLKLNGGLGTGMGLEKAKSLLPVKEGFTFLDIIAKQVIKRKTRLLLMNSFATREDSLNLLKNYPELQGDIPLDFLQNKVPKVACHDMSPVSWPEDPEMEWCPPGHGDIYVALIAGGMLDRLLEEGYLYAFVSNSDNLGAVMDETILGYFVGNKIPFMMEVTDRTEADKKGGHLAQLHNDQFILRESAQCHLEDTEHFQDITRHKYFNTNNLWLNLSVLKELMVSKEHVLGLPMIRNLKTVNPRDRNSTSVYQIESAMGAAIGVIESSSAIRVPRARFLPVKTTDDLFIIRSDAYILTDDFRVVLNPKRSGRAVRADLDGNYYKFIRQLDEHFPHGSPSLIDCDNLKVEGDVKFGKNITLKGSVSIINKTGKQAEIEDNSVIEGDLVIGY